MRLPRPADRPLRTRPVRLGGAPPEVDRDRPMTRRLRLTLPDAPTFRVEYERNMANGGAFVPTGETFELREIVEVEVELPFCGESLVEEAEVVFCAGEESVPPGGSAGVAVQFLGDPGELRQRLGRLLEIAGGGPQEVPAGFDPSERDLGAVAEEPPPRRPVKRGAPAARPGSERATPVQDDDPLRAVGDRRTAHRAAARVPARLASSNVELEGITRDLSETGVLISGDASELPIGKVVRLELTHPESGERLEVPGIVSRHVETEGTVTAVGVRFSAKGADAKRVRAFVRGVKEIEAERIRGGISGVIEELGMPNLLQMLGKSSPCGTLTVIRGAEEGVVAFEQGRLRYVRLGSLRGGKALVRLLSWDKGTFSFHAHVDPLEQEDPPVSLDGALLDALRELDEANRAERGAPQPATVFRVDREALAAESGFSKSEEAVLDLAAAGFTLRRILDVIPESDAEILGALQSLEDRGILLRR